MAEFCASCNAEIVFGAFIKKDNSRLAQITVDIVNFVQGTTHTELCGLCGEEIVQKAIQPLKSELESCRAYVQENIVNFPMMTVGQLPDAARFKIEAMVTANVTVGTGLFSEFSQGFSDFFGTTNVNSGMALKVNSGEAKARSILVNKALIIGANSIIGVDVDYGTTVNNAATINMQGTAISLENLGDILSAASYERAETLFTKHARSMEIAKILRGDFS